MPGVGLGASAAGCLDRGDALAVAIAARADVERVRAGLEAGAAERAVGPGDHAGQRTAVILDDRVGHGVGGVLFDHEAFDHALARRDRRGRSGGGMRSMTGLGATVSTA